MSSFEDNDYYSSVDANFVRRQGEGYGVISGLTVTSASYLAVAVGSGSARTGLGTSTNIVSSPSTIYISLSSDPLLPKRAIVYMDSTGLITSSMGTAGSAVPSGEVGKGTKYPLAPPLPSDSAFISEVWIPAGATVGSQLTIYQAEPISHIPQIEIKTTSGLPYDEDYGGKPGTVVFNTVDNRLLGRMNTKESTSALVSVDLVNVHGYGPQIEKVGDIIFWTYQGIKTTGSPNSYAIKWDGHRWSKPPVLIHTGYIGDTGDGHGYPGLVRSNDGYLHVITGGHDSTAFKYYVSNYPDDINSWTDVTTARIGTVQGTYPDLFRNPSNGDLFWFFRENNNGIWDYRYSTNNGTSWAAATTWYNEAIATRILYVAINQCLLAQFDGVWNIVLTWTFYYPSPGVRYDYHWCRFNMTDKHFYNISGTDLGTTLSPAEADTCKVIDSKTPVKKLYWGSTIVYPDGRILIAYDIETTGGYFEYQSKEWNGATWVNQATVCIGNSESNTFFAMFTYAGRTFIVGDAYWNTPATGEMRVYEYSWITHTWTRLADIAGIPDYSVGTASFFGCVLHHNILPPEKPIFTFQEINAGTYWGLAVGTVDVNGNVIRLNDKKQSSWVQLVGTNKSVYVVNGFKTRYKLGT